MIELLPPDLDQSLDGIQRLDCSNSDTTLASCDPSVEPPPEATAWRKMVEDASVDNATFEKALAEELNTLICSGDRDAAYVLRGLQRVRPTLLDLAGIQAPRLVDMIMNDCPVSASLTDAEKARLLSIKQAAIGAARKSVTPGPPYSP